VFGNVCGEVPSVCNSNESSVCLSECQVMGRRHLPAGADWSDLDMSTLGSQILSLGA
jgi:hypothetical protein